MAGLESTSPESSAGTPQKTFSSRLRLRQSTVLL
jgi:hypothetical protein